jgi:hypothetical protein
MRVIDVACVLYGLAGTAAASPAVPAPEVSSVVSSVIASFVAAVLYTGPTGGAPSSLKTSSTSKSTPPVATSETAAVGGNPILAGTDQASSNIRFQLKSQLISSISQCQRLRSKRLVTYLQEIHLLTLNR